jgi:MerR family copper efflux transcriptional regulator
MRRNPATQGARAQLFKGELTIGQVARLSGVSAKAIRSYEQAGILPPALRQANSYRSYSQVDVNRLILLRCLRRLGMPLQSLKPLLFEAADVRCADIQQQMARLMAERLQAIDQEIEELQRQRELVACNLHQLVADHQDGQHAFRACQVSCLPLSDPLERKQSSS